ncbi:MAG: hypothetical protein KJO11_01840 [Gemmatimonadetes bacterium]|nr:hypothetical protein [Gemmatimonadota bacterium]
MTDRPTSWSTPAPAPDTVLPPSRPSTPLDPAEFSRWLEHQAAPLRERWAADIGSREAGRGDGVDELVEGFLDLFLEVLPLTLGPLRSQAETLWVQAAQLFGSFAAQRGLAAGEVIEEFQLLRESIIRLLWASPPVATPNRMALREVLRLNRVIDSGVTHASVGHTDVLFFALFQGSGVPETLTDDARYEILQQQHAIEAEVRSLRRVLSGR